MVWDDDTVALASTDAEWAFYLVNGSCGAACARGQDRHRPMARGRVRGDRGNRRAGPLAELMGVTLEPRERWVVNGTSLVHTRVAVVRFSLPRSPATRQGPPRASMKPRTSAGLGLGEVRECERPSPKTAAQVAVKKSPQQTPLSRASRIAILEEIARDAEAYPRDRIAAIKVLEEMRQAEQPPGRSRISTRSAGGALVRELTGCPSECKRCYAAVFA